MTKLSREQWEIVNALKRGEVLRAWASEGWALITIDGIATKVDGRAVMGLHHRGLLDQIVGNSMVWKLRPSRIEPELWQDDNSLPKATS